MKTVCKKLLSLMLVAVLLVSAVPMMASAASASVPVTIQVYVQGASQPRIANITVDNGELNLNNNQLKRALGSDYVDGSYTVGTWTVTDSTGSSSVAHSNTYIIQQGVTSVTASVTVTHVVHTYGNAVVVDATCGKDGSSTVTCTVCGQTQTTPIPATGNHVWDNGNITTPATAATPGIKTYTCTVCDATKEESYSADTKTINFINPLTNGTQTMLFEIGKSMNIAEGTPVSGYIFKGWFTESDGNGAQLNDGTTCTSNLANSYFAYYIQDVKFDYDVYLNIYTNNKVDAPAKRINITSGIAVDGVVSLDEVKSVVQNYYTSKDSNGITYDGLYKATGDWVDKFNRNDKEDTFSNIGDLKEQDNVFINVMITNVKEKTSSSSGSTADSSNPKTGDGIYTTVAVFGLSVASLAAVYYIGKKRFAC